MKNYLPDLSDMILIAALGFIFYGTFKIHQPSAFIVTGFLLLIVAYIQGLPVKKLSKPGSE